jgi:hypothetical protein
MRKIGHPSPALVVSLIALFISLTGTAFAAGIVPKAKLALNSLKLQGKTAAQVAALAPAAPAPSTAITVKSGPWSLPANGATDVTTACDTGQKAIAGGYQNTSGTGLAVDTRPSTDGGSWKIVLLNLSSTAAASGTVYAVCLK